MAATHSVVRRVRHAPDDVFDLVRDVRDYPNFIKWIRAMRVHKETGDANAGALTAEAVIGYKFVRERFTTDVTYDRAVRAIDVSFVSGPFSALENRWRFAPLSDGSTQVDFWIRFQFRNPVLQGLFNASFDRATQSLMGAFEARAAQRFAMVGEPRARLQDLTLRTAP